MKMDKKVQIILLYQIFGVWYYLYINGDCLFKRAYIELYWFMLHGNNVLGRI